MLHGSALRDQSAWRSAVRAVSAASQPPGAEPMPRARRPRKGDHPAELLGPETTVNFAAERAGSGISEVLAALDSELVGLGPVKKRIQEMAALLHRLGYLDRGHLVAATRNDLVGEYIGHTAPKTTKVLARARGGVLFIDEAYYLHRADSEKDYGQEAVEILLQVMENDRDNLVVILAGYKDRMDAFFESNPGMTSRIAHHLDFSDYELDELESIGKLMLEPESYYLSEDAEATFREYLKRRMQQPRFANGRSVRNALERARLRHANRLLADPDRNWSRDDLMRLEPVDIPVSRVSSRPTELSDCQPGDPEDQGPR